MKKTLLFLLMTIVTVLGSAKKVHTLGDSTMAPYDESATVTRGWGMYFGNFLTNGWTSINYAKGGRDSRGGYNELWQTAKNNVEAGDYVIITFGHNDEKNQGMDGMELQAYYQGLGQTWTETRGTIPSTTYKEWLGKIVDEAKALGAIPIVCSPVCRSYFSGNSIRRNGRHDLGDSFSKLTSTGILEKQTVPTTDHSMDYAYHSQKLAEEKGVYFIDLTTATKELYESYGTQEKCEAQLFDGTGSTHFNTTGALLVARECARLMKAQGILADDIVLPTDLSVSPATGEMGEAYKGQTLTKEFTVNGFGLTPEEGTVTITAGEGVKISFDKTEWNSALSVNYTSSTLIKTFYAQVELTESGNFSSTITVSQGDKQIVIPVTATAVVLEGGAEMQAYWRLEGNDECTLAGPATIIPESFHGMLLQRYANPNKMQRNFVDNPTETVKDGATVTVHRWPANEIDDDPERYIEFGVKPNEGNDLKINNISLYLCGAGGNGMCAHVYYSTDNFVTRTTIFEGKNMTANNPVLIQAQPVLTVKNGEQLLVRIYPWYSSQADDKTLCISDVTISGMAVDAQTTGITLTNDTTEQEKIYYTVDGRMFNAPQHGVNIVRMNDGSVRKVIY